MKSRLVTGVDIVDISRIEKILEKSGDRFLEKIFTDGEIEYIRSKGKKPETVAGMFAGKEAISKAIGTGIGRLKWKDMEIGHDSLGRPKVEMDNKILSSYGLDYLELSISHERVYAVAFVIGSKTYK